MSESSDPQIEYKMNAFVIYGLKDGKKVNLPMGLLSKIIGTSIDQRWDNPSPTPGSICKNIAKLEILSSSDFNSEVVYSGILAEVSFKEKIDLLGWDGIESELPLPPEKGERELWKFRIVPKLNLLIFENGRSVEKKLEQYLNFFCIQNYNNSLTGGDRYDGISIEAVPVESDPVGYLRSNPNLGSFEASIRASELQKHDYGPLGKIISGLNADEERLVMKVTLSSQKRGRNLPTVLVTQLADFIESISEEDLNQARVSEYDDGKKLKPTKLLGAFHHRKKYIVDKEDAKIKALNSYTRNLINDIGAQFKIDEK